MFLTHLHSDNKHLVMGSCYTHSWVCQVLMVDETWRKASDPLGHLLKVKNSLDGEKEEA